MSHAFEDPTMLNLSCCCCRLALPEEIFDVIFSFLDHASCINVRSTCRAFRAIVNAHVTGVSFKKPPPPEQIDDVLRGMPAVRSVVLWDETLLDADFSRVTRLALLTPCSSASVQTRFLLRNPQLTHVALCCAHLDDVPLDVLQRSLVRLDRLQLYIKCVVPLVTDEKFSQFTRTLDSLAIVSGSAPPRVASPFRFVGASCLLLDGRFPTAPLRHCPHTLVVRDVTPWCTAANRSSMLKQWAEACDVTLHNSDLALIESLRDVQTLTMTTAQYNYFEDRMPTRFELPCIRQVTFSATQETLKRLLTSITSVRRLHIACLDDDACVNVPEVLAACPRLKELRISAAAASFAQDCWTEVFCCLRVLEISRLDPQQQCVYRLVRWLAQCSQLTTLSLKVHAWSGGYTYLILCPEDARDLACTLPPEFATRCVAFHDAATRSRMRKFVRPLRRGARVSESLWALQTEFPDAVWLSTIASL